jgi:hypothetical protein
VVQWNGQELKTIFDSSSQLRASVPATNIVTAGSANVTVFNVGSGSNTLSSAVPFNINNPPPIVRSLEPVSVQVGSSSITLTVTGSNFIKGATVNWNGTVLPTTFVNSGKLTTVISATNLSVAGQYQVAVTNPAPGGGISKVLDFAVNNPVPSILGLKPLPVVVSQCRNPIDVLLSVNGDNFVKGATVNWNGNSLPTTLIDQNNLTVIIPATLINLPSTVSTVSITVTNPGPGGGDSKPFWFDIIGSPC